MVSTEIQQNKKKEVVDAPIMQLAQYVHVLTLDKQGVDGLDAKKVAAQQELLKQIQLYNMAPLYQKLGQSAQKQQLIGKYDQTLYEKMVKVNEEQIAAFKDKLSDAEKNYGESEVYEVLIDTANYFALIGDREKAETAYHIAYDKAVGSGARLDIIFSLLRIGLFFNDHDLITRNLVRAQDLISQGGDWDKKNRLKVYEGVYKMSIRDFKGAIELLLDGLSTFTAAELLSYQEYVAYTLVCGLLTLPRAELKKKIIDSSEVLEVIHKIPDLQVFVSSLYDCKYDVLFQSLCNVEQMMYQDKYLSSHYRWYVKEVRILAYRQLLDSYSSLSLSQLAKTFGVSEDFIDRDISKFIALGRLNCVIDKVSNLVLNRKNDTRNHLYTQVIKQGDLVLNRVQKLSRVVNM
ncbi:hypothetical protein MP228_007655 [Amoeboaphelidium protococcarum]|nr:hypothetical protein MP228_007655 [Amoeboaphelidium protococcarum]